METMGSPEGEDLTGQIRHPGSSPRSNSGSACSAGRSMWTSSTVCRSGIEGRRRCCSKGVPWDENEIDSQQGTPPGAAAKAPRARRFRGVARRPTGARKDDASQAATSLQTCATRKQTVKPIATGSTVATVVHFALPVSL